MNEFSVFERWQLHAFPHVYVLPVCICVQNCLQLPAQKEVK